MVRAMFKKHSRAPSRTDIVEFPNRSHWLIAEPGWQDVASSAIEWAESLDAATKPIRTPA
jgi:hypothetical protein